MIAAWRYIPSMQWGLVAKIDAAEAYADVTSLRNLVLIILIIVFVLTGIMSFSIAQSISGPINALVKGAAIIGSGNLDHKVGLNLKDEVGSLSRSFDKMTNDLKTTLASRDELNREIEIRKHGEEELRLRTEELKAGNEELTFFNRTMADREERMIELKKQINDLCKQLGRPPAYDVDFGEEQQ